MLTLWTLSRSRLQARPKTTGVAGICKHKIIISVASLSASLVSPTVVKHFFYNALALNALPVHLLRQVFLRSENIVNNEVFAQIHKNDVFGTC